MIYTVEAIKEIESHNVEPVCEGFNLREHIGKLESNSGKVRCTVHCKECKHYNMEYCKTCIIHHI